MNKILLTGAFGVLAVAAAAVPAFAGLVGNPSFSHSVPVRVPEQAQVVEFDEHGRATSTAGPSRAPSVTSTSRSATPTPGPTPARSSSSVRTTEPGDDGGGGGGGDGGGGGGGGGGGRSSGGGRGSSGGGN